MKPCDCKDSQDAMSMEVQGIAINDWSLNIQPLMATIAHKHYGEVKIPMTILKKFAEWYLENQEEI